MPFIQFISFAASLINYRRQLKTIRAADGRAALRASIKRKLPDNNYLEHSRENSKYQNEKYQQKFTVDFERLLDSSDCFIRF